MEKVLTVTFMAILVFSLIGCGGNALQRSCDSLTDVGEYLSIAHIQAQTAYRIDSNLVSMEIIEVIGEAQDIITSLAGTACSLEDTFELIEDEL